MKGMWFLGLSITSDENKNMDTHSWIVFPERAYYKQYNQKGQMPNKIRREVVAKGVVVSVLKLKMAPGWADFVLSKYIFSECRAP